MPKIWFFSLISFSLEFFACAEQPNHKEIPMTFMAKHISSSINRSAAPVYEFASNPENSPNGPRDSASPVAFLKRQPSPFGE